MVEPKRFVALFDTHIGYERKNRHKLPLHDPKALSVVLQFIQFFEPHVVVLGGDILDCGAISHHNHGIPGRTEQLRLLDDAQEAREALLQPLESTNAKELVYIEGNHENWLQQATDAAPALEGILDLKPLLKLTDPRWKLIPQGGFYDLGKLTFIHGDQVSGGEHTAKAAVIAWERNVRFGHHHTFQCYTKTSARGFELGRTGVAVPCLCRKDPEYVKGRPNRWVQGFQYGYVFPDGSFNDYTVIITKGRAYVEGQLFEA